MYPYSLLSHFQAAVVYDCQAILKYGRGDRYETVHLTGIGKYPHLIVTCGGTSAANHSAETEINFGSVHIGKSSEKWIDLHNLSPVRKILSFSNGLLHVMTTSVILCLWAYVLRLIRSKLNI